MIKFCSAALRLCARNEFKAARRDAERIGEKGISNSQPSYARGYGAARQGISNFQGNQSCYFTILNSLSGHSRQNSELLKGMAYFAIGEFHTKPREEATRIP
jgi:hypothetical protein